MNVPACRRTTTRPAEPPLPSTRIDSYSSSSTRPVSPSLTCTRRSAARPQGTCRRNATGGALQFISNKPTKEFRLRHEPSAASQHIYEGASPVPCSTTAVPAAGSRTMTPLYPDVSPGERTSALPDTTHCAHARLQPLTDERRTHPALYARPARAHGGAYGSSRLADAQLQAHRKPKQTCASGKHCSRLGEQYRNDAITRARVQPLDSGYRSPTLASAVRRRIWILRSGRQQNRRYDCSITDYQYWRKNYLEMMTHPPADSNFYINNQYPDISRVARPLPPRPLTILATIPHRRSVGMHILSLRRIPIISSVLPACVFRGHNPTPDSPG